MTTTKTTVERRNVGPRIAMVEVADRLIPAAEGVEFRASCGCVCIFGTRLDNRETTCAYGPCAEHKPHADLFMARLLSPEGRDIETADWMALSLEALTNHIEI